jgi:4a-hydroxytetrahydrobiopterin dehydratase
MPLRTAAPAGMLGSATAGGAVTDAITAEQFYDHDGVEDWRVLAHGIAARFRTGSFATGVDLVDAIGELADAANHHPDVDLRYPAVTVRLISHDIGGLSERDVELARRISAAARELGVAADPTAVQDVDLTVHTDAVADVLPFWRAVLGYEEAGDEELEDPGSRWPSIHLRSTDAPGGERDRVHVDVWVPHDEAEGRVAAALDAGGRLVSDAHAPTWWTLADAEGHEVDVATWQGR